MVVVRGVCCEYWLMGVWGYVVSECCGGSVNADVNAECARGNVSIHCRVRAGGSLCSEAPTPISVVVRRRRSRWKGRRVYLLIHARVRDRASRGGEH